MLKSYEPKRREYLRASGRGILIDAMPATRHVRMLVDRYGMAVIRISELSGVSQSAVWEYYRGVRRSHVLDGQYIPIKNIKRDTLARLLSVKPEEPLGYGARILDCGTVRRLQAMTYDGFSGPYLAERMGCKRQQVQTLVSRGRLSGTLYWATAARVAELYDELDGVDPGGLGISPTCIGRARGAAHRNGYASRMCWDSDTIDDPDAWAEWSGKCGTLRGYIIHYRDRIPMCPNCANAHRIHRKYPYLGQVMGVASVHINSDA